MQISAPAPGDMEIKQVAKRKVSQVSKFIFHKKLNELRRSKLMGIRTAPIGGLNAAFHILNIAKISDNINL
jgi:hypothetical protein